MSDTLGLAIDHADDLADFADRVADRPEPRLGGAAAFDAGLDFGRNGAGLASLAVKVGSAAPIAAALYRRDDIDATTARTLVDLNGAAFLIDGLLVAVFVLAAGLSALSSRALSRWACWSAVVLGVTGLVTPIVGIEDMDRYLPIPFLLSLIWILVVGATLAVRAGRAARNGAQPLQA